MLLRLNFIIQVVYKWIILFIEIFDFSALFYLFWPLVTLHNLKIQTYPYHIALLHPGHVQIIKFHSWDILSRNYFKIYVWSCRSQSCRSRLFRAITHWIIALQLGDTFFLEANGSKNIGNLVKKMLVCKLVSFGEIIAWPTKQRAKRCPVGHAAVSLKL